MKIKVVSHFEINCNDYPSNHLYAISVYTVGCNFNCFGCQNKELQNFNYNKNVVEFEDVDEFYNELCRYKKYTNKLVFLGGEPLEHLEFIKSFLNKYGNEFDVCIYTGYDIDFVKSNKLKNFKYVKCGLYIEKLKRESKNTDKCFMLSSTNQNFYNSKYKKISKKGILKYRKERNVSRIK